MRRILGACSVYRRLAAVCGAGITGAATRAGAMPAAARAGSGKPPSWHQEDRTPAPCLEKIKVLYEIGAQLPQTAQVRAVPRELVDSAANR